VHAKAFAHIVFSLSSLSRLPLKHLEILHEVTTDVVALTCFLRYCSLRTRCRLEKVASASASANYVARLHAVTSGRNVALQKKRVNKGSSTTKEYYKNSQLPSRWHMYTFELAVRSLVYGGQDPER
jgi:hypothetical protein